MTILTDGKKTVGFTMKLAINGNYTNDCSNDFFDVGGLPYNPQTEAYTVPDVDYCIEQAKEWETGDENAPEQTLWLEYF